MKKVLWVSPYAPYDQVDHAGGKMHNFYIKTFHESRRFDITLLSLCTKREELKLDLDQYGIKNDIYVTDGSKHKEILRVVLNGLSAINPFDRYDAVALGYEVFQLKKELKRYFKSGQTPDIVVMQWTFTLMLLPIVKKYFPNCKTVAIEEDVTFQSYYRTWQSQKGFCQQEFWKLRYKREKRKELQLLHQVDLIVCNNEKDTMLLKKNDIEQNKIFTSVPYFDNYGGTERHPQKGMIFFYGAMGRPENYESAIWFIENVMPLLHGKEVVFVVVGSNPPNQLLKYQSDQVVITGYVEDASLYFQNCMCMVVPLLRGAGIKIKILEGMSAGIPILTNEVGIEGIPARSGRDYYRCDTAESYADVLTDMLDGKTNSQVGENAKKLIASEFNTLERTFYLMDRMECL